MPYDEPSDSGELEKPAMQDNDPIDSPELAALAEQLTDDAHRLARTYPSRGVPTRVFAVSRDRTSHRRTALVLAAGLSALGLMTWIALSGGTRPPMNRPVVDRGPVVSSVELDPITRTLPRASAAGVLVVPVATFEEFDELTAPEREAVFDLLEGQTTEDSYLSI